jgi:hypothetical protein
MSSADSKQAFANLSAKLDEIEATEDEYLKGIG